MRRDPEIIKDELTRAVNRRRAELGHIGRLQAAIVNDTREIGRLIDELAMVRSEAPNTPEGLFSSTGAK